MAINCFICPNIHIQFSTAKVVSEKKSIKNQVGWIGMGNLFNAIVNLLLVPYLARAMSVELYGTYGQVLMLIGIANVVFAFGFSKLIYQELNKEAGVAGAINVLSASLLLGLCGSAILFFGSDYIADFFNNSHLSSLLKIYSFSLLFILIAEIARSILTHFYKSDRIAIASIFHNILRVSIIFTAVHYMSSIESLFIGLLCLEVVNALYLLIQLPKGEHKTQLSRATIIEYLRKGFPLALSGASAILLVETDGVMISRMLSTEEYAVYRMGAIPIPFLFIVFNSVNRVTLSEVNKFFSEKKYGELIALKRKVSSAIAFITYPSLIFFIVFAEPFINFYLGSKYISSVTVFMIYNLMLFLRINNYRDVLIAASKTSWIFYIELSILFLNAVFNYFLISAFGINGAAIASISSYFILSAILHYSTTRFLGSPFLSFFNYRKLFFMVMICLGSSFLIRWTYSFFPTVEALFVSAFVYLTLSYWLLLRFKILDYDLIMNYSANISLLKPLRFILAKLR